jgi:hypothetical protein
MRRKKHLNQKTLQIMNIVKMKEKYLNLEKENLTDMWKMTMKKVKRNLKRN